MEQDINTIKTEPVTLGSKGYYSLHVYKEDGTEVVEKRITDSQNVVTYEGAYKLFFDDKLFSSMYANIGTGTTELTRSASGLSNRFSAPSSSSGASRSGNEVDNGNGTSTLTLVRGMSFSLGDTTGTFSEVGISTSSNGNNFIAGQLIKDEFGNPTTITVLADEQLSVTYTLELSVPNGEQGGKNIGTGTVPTPEGAVGYTLYAQPFFGEYSLNDSDERTVDFEGDEAFLRSSTDANSGSSTKLTVGSSSLSRVDGTVSLTTGNNTAPPSAFSRPTLKYALYGSSPFGSGSAGDTGVDTINNLRPSRYRARMHTLLIYDTPINADNTRSYKAQLTLTYNI